MDVHPILDRLRSKLVLGSVLCVYRLHECRSLCTHALHAHDLITLLLAATYDSYDMNEAMGKNMLVARKCYYIVLVFV